MQDWFKLSVVTFCILALTACATSKKEITDDEKNRLATAKVNAQLGIAYLEQNNVEKAKKKLLVAIAQAPDLPEPWYAMGYFLETTGNKRDAAKYYQQALKISPTRGDVRNNYGTFLCRKNQYKIAIDQFMLAVKDPNYLSPSDAYENAGLCALKIPNKALAERYFLQALKEDSSRPTSLIKLAEINYKNGKYLMADRRLKEFLKFSIPTTESLALRENLAKKLNDNELSLDPTLRNIPINNLNNNLLSVYNSSRNFS